jgi:small-conductance mechanosensitive channel
MVNWYSEVLPPWARLAVMTLIVVASSYVIGQVLRSLLARYLMALAKKTTQTWDDAVVGELSKRVPLWVVLLGLYVAAGFWPLAPHVETTVTNALIATAGISVTLMAAAIVVSMTRDYYARRAHGDKPITTITQNVARIVVVMLGTLTILHTLNVSIAPLLTALGVGGLAVALALQDTLANLFAGIQVTLAKQVRVGDYIKLDSGNEGHLVDIAWRSARILMGNNNSVVVPNSKLAQAIVINYGLPNKEIVTALDFSVSYGSDLSLVERVSLEEAREVTRTQAAAVSAFEPVLRFQEFGESAIAAQVVMRARDFGDQGTLKHELIKRLHARFAKEGIAIPYPTRTLVAEPGRLVLTRDSAA